MKKGIYTFKEITALALKKWPGRWMNDESAYASIKAAAQRLKIGDINGKQKYKQIAAVDVSRILEELERTNTRKASGNTKGQQNFFALLPREDITETEKRQLADALKNAPTVLINGQSKNQDPQRLKALKTAADILADALRVFIVCLCSALENCETSAEISEVPGAFLERKKTTTIT